MTEQEKTLAKKYAMLEDLFDVLNGNTDFITLEEFQRNYGAAEFNGPDGGSPEPYIILNGFKITAA